MTVPDSISAPALGVVAYNPGDVLTFAELRLDVPGRALSNAHGEPIPLTAAEFRLLEALLRHAGRVMSRDQLLETVSRRGAEPFDRSIDVLVGRLRRKLERNPKAPELIVTVVGFGYKFTVRPVPAVSPATAATDEAPPLPSPLRQEAGGAGGAGDSPSNARGIVACPCLLRDARSESGAPTVAVLPFASLGGESGQDGFCDGLADDLRTELARCRSLSVVAHNPCVVHGSRFVDVMRAGRELGARYVLEGSARRVAGRVRINVLLTQVEAGSHVWAQRYDPAQRGALAAQDAIATEAARAVVAAVADAELRRALRTPLEALGPWELYQRGLWHLAKFDPRNHERARELFERAIALDPDLAPALSALGTTYATDALHFYTRPPSDAAALAVAWARRTLDVDPTDAGGLALLAAAMMLDGNVEEAAWQASRARAADPHSPLALCASAWTMMASGRSADALDALLPYQRDHPGSAFQAIAIPIISQSYYLQRDYGRAAAVLLPAVARYRQLPELHGARAASLGQLGRSDAARDALRTVVDGWPQGFQTFTTVGRPWFRPRDHDHALDGLHKAGWRG